ncbi:hypothetical protein [Brevibacillus laterosporus]|uniref:hypothetical protein n=1 Tax=Brevibacillus laterosporus TaxID=1465 RepID=UPI003D190695
MIRREIKKNNFDTHRQYPGQGGDLYGNPDDVVSLDVVRGGNSYDNELITALVIGYADTTVENITLLRGVVPAVPNTVPDHEFINKALVTGFRVEVISPYGSRQFTGEIIRENGYGKVLNLNLTYSN